MSLSQKERDRRYRELRKWMEKNGVDIIMVFGDTGDVKNWTMLNLTAEVSMKQRARVSNAQSSEVSPAVKKSHSGFKKPYTTHVSNPAFLQFIPYFG